MRAYDFHRDKIDSLGWSVYTENWLLIQQYRKAHDNVMAYGDNVMPNMVE